MVDKEILNKAIKQAKIRSDVIDCFGEDYLITLLNGRNYFRLIFSHDFAKAFWGEGRICIQCKTRDLSKHLLWCNFPSNTLVSPEAWQYYLRQMVIEKNPLKYIEKFLEVKNESKAN